MVAAILTIDLYKGSDIKESIQKAKQLASLLDVMIKFEFNSVQMIVSKNADVQYMVDEFYEKVCFT
jgi:hypothetical protein